MIPSAFMIFLIRALSDSATFDWSKITPSTLPLATTTSHKIVQYPTAMIDPMNETNAKEFKFGQNRDTRIVKHIKTKNHSVVVKGYLEEQSSHKS